jgi:extracellular matrix regulatory protein A
MAFIGHKSYVNPSLVFMVTDPDSNPNKKRKRAEAEKGMLIDTTGGKKTKSLIISISNQVTACALTPDTLASRLSLSKKKGKQGLKKGPQNTSRDQEPEDS